MYFSLQILKSVKQKEVHRGELLKAAADASGMTIEAIVQKMGYASRNTFYNHTRKSNLSLTILDRYAKVLKFDFSNEVEGLNNLVVSEPDVKYLTKPTNFEDALERIEYWRSRFYEELEKNNRLLEELNKRDG
jgi:hypothetical protein